MRAQLLAITLGLTLLALLIAAAPGGAAQTQPIEPTPTDQADSARGERRLVPMSGVQEIAAGEGHSCALLQDGQVMCWGNNFAGALGDGTNEDRDVPVQVAGLESGISAIAAGADFNCALDAAGGVQCWGYNASGQLGDGTTEDRWTPVQVAGLDAGVVAISAGRRHACALSSLGEVLCWGDNNYGKVNGNREQNDQDILEPVPVQGLDGDFVSIAAGFAHTCALSSVGSVTCWGAPVLLGIDRYDYGPLIVPGLEQGVQGITAGIVHSCAWLASGEVRCWGNNEWGQMGSELPGESRQPSSVAGLPTPIRSVAAGPRHTCAIAQDRMFCWGNNDYGQLGDGTTESRSAPQEVLGLGTDITSMATGYDHTCAVSAGEAFCWGLHLSGQLGQGLQIYGPVPVETLGLPGRAVSLAAGESHNCAVLENGGLACWGDDRDGQLGDGREGIRGAPAAVLGLGQAVVSVTAGGDFTCALSAAGGVQCWGGNTWGYLGDGTDDRRSSPGDVTGLSSGVRDLAAGRYHACALTETGGVTCWGWNNDGQLGDGGILEESLVPVDVVGLDSRVRDISAGYSHTCALLDRGSVSCWGDVPTSDQIAHGPYAEPIEIPGLPPDIASLISGQHHSCVLTTQGDLHCWGISGGSGLDLTRINPEGVTVLDAAGGWDFTCILDDRGRVGCVGDNDAGQLGDGTTEARESLLPVQGLPNGIVALTAGEFHACALSDAGAVFCWGANLYGQLGDGTMPRASPVSVLLEELVPARAFREPSTFVPELTTYIPTPLDLSTDPAVVGTNLALAALAMLPFAVAAELLTRTLGERRLSLPSRYEPLLRLGTFRQRLDGALRRLVRQDRLREVGRAILILLFYGLVFSLLDQTWKPFTLGGLVLLVYMTIAYGVVGLADDIAQWRAARRWKLPAQFSLRMTNVVLALASTATTRLLKLVPGLMFGTPEALRLEEDRLEEPHKTRLTRVSALTLVVVALGLWIPSALTAWLQNRGLSGGMTAALGGLEAFLVLTFAVALENIFVKTLGLPGSMGEALRRRNRWLWLGALVASGFVFYHTLLNPRGELATALQEGNVQVFLAAVATFVLFSCSLWFYYRWRERQRAPALETPTPKRAAVKLASWRPPRLKLPASLVRRREAAATHRRARRGADSAPPTAPPFTPDAPAMAAPGSGLESESVAAAEQPAASPIAAQASNEPASTAGLLPHSTDCGPITDPHLRAEPALQEPLAEPVAPMKVPAQLPGIVEGTKKCPMCAETIKLEARICRYCRTGFEVVVQGYCMRCHALVPLDLQDRCSVCSGEVIDRQVRSIWLGEHSGAPVAREAGPAAAGRVGQSTAASTDAMEPSDIPATAVSSPEISPAIAAHPTIAASPEATMEPRRPLAGARRILLPVAGVATFAIGGLLVARYLSPRPGNTSAPQATPAAGLPAQVQTTVTPGAATPRPTRTSAPTRTQPPTQAPTAQPAWVDAFAAPILAAAADRRPDFDYGFNLTDWGPPGLDIQQGRIRVEQPEETFNIFLRGHGLYDFAQVLEVTFEQPATIALTWYGSKGELGLYVTLTEADGWHWHLQGNEDGENISLAKGHAEGIRGLSGNITLIRYHNAIAAFFNDVPLAYIYDPDLLATYYGTLQVLSKPPGDPVGVVWFDRLRMWDLRLVPDLPEPGL